MADERRRATPIQWTFLGTMLLQIILLVYGYGKIVQRVDDLVDRVARIEQRVNTWLDAPRR